MNHRVSAVTYDTIIRGGLWFDGTGAEPAVRDLGILDGRVAAESATPLEAGPDTEVVEAAGRWVMPGMVDIHTHYDVEVRDHAGAVLHSASTGTTTSAPVYGDYCLAPFTVSVRAVSRDVDESRSEPGPAVLTTYGEQAPCALTMSITAARAADGRVHVRATR